MSAQPFPLPVLPDDAPAASGSPFDRRYWTSLEERLHPPEAAPEFPPGAEDLDGGLGRRDLMKLLGASLAFAGVTGCTRPPAEKILPYGKKPPEVTPGNPLHYATAFCLEGHATGLLATCFEGRPTLVAGNPDHPSSLGAAGVFEQASLLQLYDPARARLLKRRGVPTAPSALEETLAERGRALEAKQGEGLYLLVEPTASPTLLAQRARLLRRFPKARVFAYGPAFPAAVYEGTRAAFGQPLQPQWDLTRAEVIVSLDCDFLEARGEQLALARAFADRRVPPGPMNRLYLAEARLSVTGMSADHRLPTRQSGLHGLALALAHAVGRRLKVASLSGARGPEGLSPAAVKWVEAAAEDLVRAGSGAVVMPGPRLMPATHVVLHAVNAALGAHGTTVRFTRPALGAPDVDAGPGALQALAAQLRAGAVDTLLITAANPAYARFADVALGDLLEKVPLSVYHCLFEDETAPRCTWVVPAAHPLESWGDARAADGTASILQPLILPLFGGVTASQLFALLLPEPKASPYEQVRAHWRAQAGGPDFERRWESWLARGVVQEPPAESVTPAVDEAAVARALAEDSAGGPDLELAFAPDYKVYDGRFANNGWLQELPDPVTKLTWDNALLMSEATARGLGVKTHDLVSLTARGHSVEVPVYVLPGHADGTVTLPLGYGRLGTEKVARQVGTNAYSLRHSDAPWLEPGVQVVPLGREHRLAVTQEHWRMEGRPIGLELTLAELATSTEQLAALRGTPESLFTPPSSVAEGHRWAMAVDLSRCTGCMACVVACQAENNIPIVGRANVLKSREMHWLRVDRYFSGDLHAPSAITQPMMCQHCEAAPCEYVCPVNATVHSDEGLNEMVYNRCVGTRYCSNNCPYKVRRFNFLHYSAGKSATEQMAMNPNVTVRARGVMEKCTYCVQRIERTRIEAGAAGRPMDLSQLKTACQQACPTTAIAFGSLSEPNSRVARLHRDARRYDVLHELGTRPRTAYLARVRNPNPALEAEPHTRSDP